jgi:DNA polymerase type B, organellar and viral
MANVSLITKERSTLRSGKSHHGSYKRKFVAIDGEGETINGRHEYVLLGIGQDQITNPQGLHWTEIFAFLYEHYEPAATYIGFFLGYDFTQWFKSLSEYKAWQLLTREGIAQRKHRNAKVPTPHAVQSGGWQFDILGNKRFRFRPKVCDCDVSTCKCPGQLSWMYICDCGPFFQKAFLSVIDSDDWPPGTITKQEYEDIKEGKGKRSTAHLGEEMMHYNRLENNILERIMYLFDEAFVSIGIHLKKTQWFGPGQAAQEWLKGRAPKREEIEGYVPDWFREFARESYYGGWFEIFAHGLIPGCAFEYDLNSAYPYIIATLPCLLHGIYSRGTGFPIVDLEQKEICLVRACVSGTGNASRYSGTMPNRNKNGGICRPIKSIGTYWYHELEAAKRSGCVSDIQYYEWVKYTPCKCPPPMQEIEHLYELRLSVGKNTPFGMACRLVYNSMYGKFAQSVGEPTFGNAVYASLITSGCRTMILDAVATHPNQWEDVLMVATDGVYFRTEHPTLPLSKTVLGAWDVKEKKNMCLFKPGVYWDDKARADIEAGELPHFKARGISAKDFADHILDIDYRFACLDGDYIGIDDWPSISYVPQFHMTTALQALIQHDWSLAGLVSDDKEFQQNSSPHEKRSPIAVYDAKNEIYRTVPRRLDDYISRPYSKRFGDTSGDANERPFTQEWLERWGITPDEYVGDTFIRILTGKEG